MNPSRQRRTNLSHRVRETVLAAALLALPGGAQFIPHTTSQFPRSNNPADLDDPAARHQRELALNRERQKAIVSDTDKLLKLAGEFDLEVKNSDSEALTPAEERKLAMIEKLAKNVKDKMSYSPPAASEEPLFPIRPPNY